MNHIADVCFVQLKWHSIVVLQVLAHSHDITLDCSGSRTNLLHSCKRLWSQFIHL